MAFEIGFQGINVGTKNNHRNISPCFNSLNKIYRKILFVVFSLLRLQTFARVSASSCCRWCFMCTFITIFSVIISAGSTARVCADAFAVKTVFLCMKYFFPFGIIFTEKKCLCLNVKSVLRAFLNLQIILKTFMKFKELKENIFASVK